MFNYFKISRFFLYLIPLGVMIVTPSTLFPFIVGKYVFFRTMVGLALIFYLLGLLFQPKEVRPPKINGQSWGDQTSQILKSPLVIAVSVFVLIFLLAGFFGVDPANSFWSNFERGEGGLQIIHLWLFFILLIALFKEEKDWQKLFIIAIIGGVGMALYGFMAGAGVSGFIGGKFSDPGFRLSGSIGNPAYVAAYAIFMMFYSAYLLVSKYWNRFLSGGAITLFTLIVFFLAVFWLAATRGAFFGLIAALMAFLGYLIYSHKFWRKWLLMGVFAVLLIVGSGVYFKDTAFVKSLPGSRVFDISLSAETFQTRWIIWGTAFKGWQERPILGWGPENFINVFDRHFNPSYVIAAKSGFEWFDRAHSVYFGYLVETGILGLLSFLSIFIVYYKTLINADKKLIYRDKKSVLISQNQYISVWQRALLFSLPMAYLVQGIALFDVLPIYFNLFLFLAFASYKFNLKSQISNLKNTS